MALNPSNSSSLEQLALKGLITVVSKRRRRQTPQRRLSTVARQMKLLVCVSDSLDIVEYRRTSQLSLCTAVTSDKAYMFK